MLVRIPDKVLKELVGDTAEIIQRLEEENKKLKDKIRRLEEQKEKWKKRAQEAEQKLEDIRRQAFSLAEEAKTFAETVFDTPLLGICE